MSSSRPALVATLVGLLSCVSARVAAEPTWSLERSSDPRTGATISTALTIYREGGLAKAAAVRCRERTLEVYVDFGEPIGRERASVRFRADQGGWARQEWAVSDDGTAVFARDQARIARLWMRGTRFVIETTASANERHRAAFVLSGSGRVIRPVLEQCGVAVRDK